jgi:hypothetical protein
MDVKRRLGILLAGTVLGTSFLASAPAFADDAQLQQQINTMQRQLQVMQDQLAETKRQAKAAAQQAQQTQAAQEQQAQNLQNINSIPPNLYAADVPIPTKSGPSWFDSIHVSMAGSFLAMEGVWRQRNEVASGATDTPFSQMPFSNSPLYHENEMAFSAQQSRIALKASGDLSPWQHLYGYYEMDFLGAATTANSRESNSYTPRQRQLFFGYDNDNYHFHFSAGQMWSLVTQDRVGELNLTENTPLTIDAQYVVGFNWARQPAIRFVEDWNKVAWFGVSVEAPQTAFQSNSVGILGNASQSNPGSITVPAGGLTAGATNAVAITPTGATNIGGATAPPGMSINNINVCNASGLLNSTTGCSINNYPDIVEKFALDPGWGHYEAIGLQRFFTDRVYTTAVPGSGTNKTTAGWGIGGNALLPVWPKFIDLQGSVMYGAGLGRYGSSQLPDVTIASNGSLQPLTTLQFLVGAVAHPWEALDVYVYYGQEQLQSNFWNITSGGKTTSGGYGNPAFVNTGCLLENQLGGPAGFNDPIPGTSCAGATNVQRVNEITGGFWYNVYKGDLGRVRVGLQYEYWTLNAFGTSPTPASVLVPAATTGQGAIHTTPNAGLNPNNQAVFFSLRYYPFN